MIVFVFVFESSKVEAVKKKGEKGRDVHCTMRTVSNKSEVRAKVCTSIPYLANS